MASPQSITVLWCTARRTIVWACIDVPSPALLDARAPTPPSRALCARGRRLPQPAPRWQRFAAPPGPGPLPQPRREGTPLVAGPLRVLPVWPLPWRLPQPVCTRVQSDGSAELSRLYQGITVPHLVPPRSCLSCSCAQKQTPCSCRGHTCSGQALVHSTCASWRRASGTLRMLPCDNVRRRLRRGASSAVVKHYFGS